MSELSLDNGSSTRRRFFTFWTIVWILLWVGVFVIMHMPRVPGPRLDVPRVDKLAHFCVFFVLALAGYRAGVSRGVLVTRGWVVKWIAIYAAYGMVDEIFQPYFGRTAELLDWVADVLGVTTALSMCYLNHPRSPRPKPDAPPPAPGTTAPVTADMWKHSPMPAKREQLEMDIDVSAEQFERIRRGLYPTSMDDKWFCYVQDDCLFMHRSQTGFCIFMLKFEPHQSGWRVAEVWVNRDTHEYGSIDAESDKKLLAEMLEVIFGVKV